MGGPIAWKLKKQTSMVQSTTEAGCYALGVPCQEAMWLRQLFQEISMTFNLPLDIFRQHQDCGIV